MPRIDGLATRVPMLVGLLAAAGCLEHEAVDLSGKACPCAEGWTCDDTTDTCVRGSGGGGGDRDAGPRADAGPDGDAGAGLDGGPVGEDAGLPTGTFWFEAEEAMPIEPPMQTGDDPDASGGSYATVNPTTASSTASRPDMGSLSFPFTVTESAEFRAWGRVRVTLDSDDSFWVCMDACPTADDDAKWNDLSLLDPVDSWVWDDIHDSDVDGTVPVTWSLDPGDHTLIIYYRETGARLDKVVITDDADLVPSGLGE